MENFQLFEQIKSVHVLLAALTFLSIIISDLYVGLWVIGKKEFLNFRVLTWLHKIVFAGLTGLIITGLGLVYLDQSYFSNPGFLLKMFFVIVLFVNAFRIGKEMHIPAEKKFIDLSYLEKKRLLIVGATSTISWVSVFILVGLL